MYSRAAAGTFGVAQIEVLFDSSDKRSFNITTNSSAGYYRIYEYYFSITKYEAIFV